MDSKRAPERHTGNCETSHFLMTESRPAVYSTERERSSLRALIPNRWRTSISCDRITYETRILERLDELILMRRAHYCRRVYIGIPRHCSLHVAGNQWAVMLIQSFKFIGLAWSLRLHPHRSGSTTVLGPTGHKSILSLHEASWYQLTPIWRQQPRATGVDNQLYR